MSIVSTIVGLVVLSTLVLLETASASVDPPAALAVVFASSAAVDACVFVVDDGVTSDGNEPSGCEPVVVKSPAPDLVDVV